MKTVLVLMNNVLVLGLLGLFAMIHSGCRARERAPNVLRVGVSPVPHAVILEQVKPVLAREGIIVEVVEMTDYVQPNVALVEKELDANFFQHQPYLDAFNRSGQAPHTSGPSAGPLVPLAKVHIEPLGVYSRKVKALANLRAGAVIAIPNDPTNATRALELLAAAGVIQLRTKSGATVQDVIVDAKTPKLRELEGAQLPRTLEDVDAAVINTNYALEAGLTPARDALVREDATSRYANVLVARADRADDARLKALARELTSEATRRFIEERFRGSLVPAF
jgi:D-methionine transport system substrate-binding protein